MEGKYNLDAINNFRAHTLHKLALGLWPASVEPGAAPSIACARGTEVARYRGFGWQAFSLAGRAPETADSGLTLKHSHLSLRSLPRQRSHLVIVAYTRR